MVTFSCRRKSSDTSENIVRKMEKKRGQEYHRKAKVAMTDGQESRLVDNLATTAAFELLIVILSAQVDDARSLQKVS